MRNTIVYLIGPYGVGKLTVAKALAALTGARLIDNHLINNVVFSVIRADGKTPLPSATWTYIEQVREAAFGAMETLAPPEFSFILTNCLDDTPDDRRWFDRVVLAAERRQGLFVPVIVTCEEGENMRRIPLPDRAAGMKHTDVPSALQRRRSVRQLSIDHSNRLDLDTTTATPEQSAEAILAHVRAIR